MTHVHENICGEASASLTGVDQKLSSSSESLSGPKGRSLRDPLEISYYMISPSLCDSRSKSSFRSELRSFLRWTATSASARKDSARYRDAPLPLLEGL